MNEQQYNIYPCYASKSVVSTSSSIDPINIKFDFVIIICLFMGVILFLGSLNRKKKNG